MIEGTQMNADEGDGRGSSCGGPSRRRIQFSIWNLMLMMIPLAVVLGLASQSLEKSWMVWFSAVVVGGGPAVGALIGGWKGMIRGLLLTIGWLLLPVVMGLLQIRKSSSGGAGRRRS